MWRLTIACRVEHDAGKRSWSSFASVIISPQDLLGHEKGRNIPINRDCPLNERVQLRSFQKKNEIMFFFSS